MVKRNKRTGRYAHCLLDRCHSIGLRPPFSAIRASNRPATLTHNATLNAATYSTALTLRCSVAASYNDTDDAHHSDNVYMTSQPIAIKIETSLFYRIDCRTCVLIARIGFTLKSRLRQHCLL